MNTHDTLEGLYFLHYRTDILERNIFDAFQLENNGHWQSVSSGRVPA
jgi:hypothetical protein